MKTPKTKNTAKARSGLLQRPLSLHPAAKAFNEWLSSEEGKACTKGVQIGHELHGHYMENRCRRAFNVGWRAAVKAKSTHYQSPPIVTA